MSSSGTLYGATSSGGNSQRGGVLFQLDRKFTVLYTFCSETNCRDGANPFGDSLLQDSSGNIFGIAANGGTGQNGAGGGVAFELVP